MRALATVTLVGLLAGPAGAEDTAPTVDVRPLDVSTARRVGAIGAALGPGLLFRGVGSYVVGEKRAAKRLAITGGIGLASLIAGGVTIIASGASENTVAAIPLVLFGAGVIFPTWFADIAVAAGLSPDGGLAKAAPPWSIELGTLWLNDPFRSRGLGTLAVQVELGRVGIGATALLDTEGAQDTEALESRFRVFGPAPSGALLTSGHSDRLHVAAAVRRHRDDPDDVTLQTAELDLRGRLELVHLDRALTRQFIDGNLGVGIERAGYPRDEHDLSSILLAGFAYGVYVGRGSELAVYYDHRRDSMAGGIAASRAAGFVGSIGGRLLARLDSHWAVRGEVQVGNGWLWSMGLRYEGLGDDGKSSGGLAGQASPGKDGK